MSTTNVPYGDSAAKRLYAQEAYLDFTQRSPLSVLASEGCLYTPEEINGYTGAGDSIRINTFGEIGGAPVGEDQSLENNEVALRRSSFYMEWNETWFAAKVPSRTNIKQARLTTDLTDTAGKYVFDYMGDLIVSSVFNQAAGFTGTSYTRTEGTVFTGTNLKFVNGHNTVTAPSTNRIFRPNSVANDQSLTASDTFSIDILDDIESSILSNAPTFQIPDGGMIIGFLHPKQVRDLKRDSGGRIQWYQNALALAQGGEVTPIKNGSMFGTVPVAQYNSFLLYQDRRVPNGVNSGTNAVVANVRRAVFFGQQAVFYASPLGTGIGVGGDDAPFVSVNEMFDYERFTGVGAGSMHGIKNFVGYNGETNNTFVVPTYAA